MAMFENVFLRYFFLILCLACSMSLADVQIPKDIVLVLDNSGSMKKNDPEFAAKGAVMGFVADMRGDTRLSILVFDKNVRHYFPLSQVSDETRYKFTEFVNKINYNGLYTNSLTALEAAIEELTSQGRSDAKKTIVFLTDGIVDTGNPARDTESIRQIESGLNRVAQDKEINIYTIAFTDKADVDMLLALSESTGGKLSRAQQANQLFSVFYQFAKQINQDALVIAEDPTPPEPIQEPTKPESTLESEIWESNTSLPIEPEEPSVETPLSSTVPPDSQPVAGNTEEAGPSAGFYLLIALLVAILGVGVVGLTIALLRKQKESRINNTDRPAYENSGRPEAYLIGKTDVLPNQSYTISGASTLVGRTSPDPNEHLESLIIDHKSIGRRHAIIEYEKHGYWLIDLKSVNGTFVNGKRVTDKIRLTHGDTIHFHNIEFRFAIPSLVEADKTVISSGLSPNLAEKYNNPVTENFNQPDEEPSFSTVAEESDDLENQVDESSFVDKDYDDMTRIRPQASEPSPVVTKDIDESTLLLEQEPTLIHPAEYPKNGDDESDDNHEKDDTSSDDQQASPKEGNIEWYQHGSQPNPYAEETSDPKPDPTLGTLIDEFDTDFKPPKK